ncbi:hypothetical protein FRC01_001701 [Tulasnella sp. 417]|nr:hypothetical protein FRC01_001701 [Tulasnella sp. 417]
MALSASDKENDAASHPAQTRGVLDPTVIAASSSRILQQSRQALAPKVHYDLLTSDPARPQLFDANGRPTHLTSRASYKYHNGKLSVKRQKARLATETQPPAAPTNSELLAIAHNDDSDVDADGEQDWEDCNYDFTASPVQLSAGRRTELTGVRRSIPFLASLSGARKLSPPTPPPRPPVPEVQQTSEPKPSPATAEVVAPPTSEPQPAPHPPPKLPALLPATQESELTELSESEGHLYDYPIVPQRHAAAVAEARVSVQTKKVAIKRGTTPAARAPYDKKGRGVRGNWTLEEEIKLVRFVLEGASEFEWDKKAAQLSKRLPLRRSLNEVKARKAAGELCGDSEEGTTAAHPPPPALLKPENNSSEDEAPKKKPSAGKRKRDPVEDAEVEAKASKKITLRSDDVVKWTSAEDKQLLQAVAKYAQVDWNLVRTELSGLQAGNKTPQSLEKRWNVLKTALT